MEWNRILVNTDNHSRKANDKPISLDIVSDLQNEVRQLRSNMMTVRQDLIRHESMLRKEIN